MNFIVVGCGRVGAELAHRLFKKGHKVTIIDTDHSAFSNLSPDFRGRTVEGEVLNEDVLRRAGIEEADGLAAVTVSDSLNAVVAYIAREVYHLQNVVARNYDPQYRPLQEAFELQIVGSSSWGAQRIEELLHQTETHTIFSAGNGEVALYEFVIPPLWDGRTNGELMTGEGFVLAALTRSGKATLPDGDYILRQGDVVLVSGTAQGIQTLWSRLYQKQEA
jgi:trk system potassium uptake protein TrkA